MKWILCALFLCKIIICFCNANGVEIASETFCNKPNTKMFKNVTNCISSSYFFPSTSMFCDYCGNNITFTCSPNKTWEFHEVVDCQYTKKEENSDKKCPGLNDITIICPHINKVNEYSIGTRTICTCKSNCRDFVVKCKASETKNNPSWSSEYKYNPCAKNTTSIYDGSLMKIHYENDTYTYECIGDYILHGAGKAYCIDGELSKPKPICRVMQDVTIEIKDANMTIILYILVAIFILLSITLCGYLIYMKIKRKKNEIALPENKLELQDAIYDYPVFHIVDDLNPAEDEEYDYPVIPNRDQSSVKQEEIKENLEYVGANEFYPQSEDETKSKE